ncbi:otoferlin [Bradysia coprophila]|uniref:otoferlin n=1 Tax=Bradysia coprophila TaxID=38358 RepID=UPI00187DD26A|nr:otoferlin [Bradysia coprophila]
MSCPKDQCFVNLPQHFLVCLTVHKVKDLQTLNADTYVTVTLDKKLKQTATFKNSDCPYFNEYFVFEHYCSLTDLLRLNVSLVVFQKRGCVKKDVRLGEIVVDLNMVWNLENHAFHKKWGVLENTDAQGTADGGKSYLQFDLAIISKDDKPAPAVFQIRDYDNVESNLLQPLTTTDVYHKVKYVVNIYRGCDFSRNGNYAVQVCFAANVLRTKMIRNTQTPEWNEQFCFPGNYPSLCQTMTIQVMKSSSYYAMAEIYLDEICDDGFELVHYPTIGPTYFQLYDATNKNKYMGRLLLSIETDPVDMDTLKKPKTSIVPSLIESEYWSTESFDVRVIVYNVSRCLIPATKLKIQFHLGTQSSNIVEYPLCEYDKGSKNFFSIRPTTYQVMYVSIQLPDNRLKFQIQFSLDAILDEMQIQMKRFKLWVLSNPKATHEHLQFARKIVHELTEMMTSFCGNLYFKIFKRLTQWDKNRVAFLQAFIEESITKLEETKESLDCRPNDTKHNLSVFEDVINKFIASISNILANSLQDKWPDLIIEMHGNNDIIYYRSDSRIYTFSQNKSSTGKYCGNRHDVILKPIGCSHTCTHCGCYAGSANLSVWLGTNQDNASVLPVDSVQSENGLVASVTDSLFKCNVYIHQAKIRPGADKSGLADALITATLNDTQGSTGVIHNSLSPLWNEVITFNCIKMVGSPLSYLQEPAIILLDIYDIDVKKKLSKEFLCTAILRPLTRMLEAIASISPTPEIPNVCSKPIDSNGESETQSEPPSKPQLKRPTLKHIIEKIENRRSKRKLPDFASIAFPIPLQWIEAVRDGEVCAEILCSAEFIQLPDKTVATEPVSNQIGIPPVICPHVANYRVEVTFAGLRHCKNLPTRTMGRYKIEMSFAELSMKSGLSGKKHGNSVNFLDPFRAGYVSLPEETKYWPPIVIKHVDCSNKKETAIGAAMFSNTGKFLTKPVDRSNEQTGVESNKTRRNRTELLVKQPMNKLHKFLHFPKIKARESGKSVSKASKQRVVENKFTWYTKFYNSLNCDDKGGIEKHRLRVFDCELEKIDEYSNLTDWAEPMNLMKGTNSKKLSGPKDVIYGMLKCNIRVIKTSEGNNNEAVVDMRGNRSVELSSLITETKIVVRIYVVQGINLRSKDSAGNSDPYLRIEYGTNKVSDRAHYITNQANPIFGKRFQVTGILPKDTQLKISVYDYDECRLNDDLIGSTVIDVEDRLRSKHRAYCGLAEEYSSYGYNMWRDHYKPSQILKQLCHKYDLGEPNYVGNKINLAGITFDDTTILPSSESKQERLSLSVLKELDRIPEIGFKLCPEHVETRSLYRSDRPGIEQGKLQLWIEIFEPEHVPEPIDLTPLPPRAYELRVIVWNTSDVILDEKNVFGKYMSDIYVKGWLTDVEDAQYTDTHYRSMTGEGNFNWRMIFPLLYSDSEDVMVVRKKLGFYDKFDTESKLPTNLQIELWDNDAISADDFLGVLAINISNIPVPAKTAAACGLKKQQSEFVNLFEVEKVRGWFPAKGITKDGKMGQTGKIELELEVLLADVAAADPVGKGREDPHALPTPNRPDSSFNFLTNPFRLVKYMTGKLTKYIRYGCSILIGIVILALLFYILPSNTFHFGRWRRNDKYSEWTD